MFVRSASFLAAAALLATSGGAIAGPAMETKSIEVAYGDLNLASDAGERRLERRIRFAAGRVCGNPGSHGLQAMRRFEDCRSAAISAAGQEAAVAVAAARNAGPALASAGGGSITVARAASEE